MKFNELEEIVADYAACMESEEKSASTINQYRRDISEFLKWAGEMKAEKPVVVIYKEQLLKKYKVSSVNVKLAALNSFFLLPEWKSSK